MRGEGKYDGVFGLWYGKGPGVDRSGDVFRHANMAGSSKHGGVLALMGDDHTAESSTVAHQSEFHFVDVMIPILNPAGVQEILDYGLYGYAMSRFCGTWVAFKCVKDNIESTASVDGSLDRVKIVIPDDFAMPPGGLNIRNRDGMLDQEARLQDYKRDAMLAFVRANNLNRIVLSGGRNPKIGIITVGKSYLDVRQALDELGLDEVKANDMGLRLYKVACPWPLSQRELVGFRARPRHGHRRRGEALPDRGAAARGALRHRQPAALHRQEGRGAATGSSRSRARSIPTTSPSRSASACSRYHNNDDLRGRVARLRHAQEVLADDQRRGDPHAAFLLRLPAQHLDQGARGHARLCGHRLPLHGAVDGPLHRRLHADGRRGRELDRRGAVLEARPRLPEPRRRHLQPFRRAGAALVGRIPRPTSPTRSSSTTRSP